MTISSEHPSHEDLSAYALGALEPGELQAIERHISGCQDCRRILAEYRAVADGLLFATPPQPPPPQLRARLADQISGRRTAQPPKVEPSGAEKARPVRRGFPFLQAALGLAVILLMLVNLALGFQIRTLQRQQQALLQLIQQNQAGLALISQPGARTLPITGAQGRGNLVVAPDGSTAVLFLQDLPQLPDDRAFQVWLIPPEGAPRSAGLFRSQAGQPYSPILVQSQEPLSSFAAIGVSIEPREGSPAPTTEPILVVNL